MAESVGLVVGLVGLAEKAAAGWAERGALA